MTAVLLFRNANAHEAAGLLRARLGDRISTRTADRETHGRGESLSLVLPPDLVIFPENGEEVAFAVKICGQLDVPIIPFGAGTSLEGQVQAIRGGLCIDLTRMNRLLDVSQADLDCRVEAGVTRKALNLHLRDQGLFFPLDPGANATLGGMAATRASGTNAVRYGTMREAVLGLTVVTPAGEIIKTGGRARKSAAGYDLTRLYVGSEGTLGIITELQLRLQAIPEVIAAGVCQFDTIQAAVETVTATLQMGVPIARIELLDALQMRACIGFCNLKSKDAKPSLFVEFHGSAASVKDQISQFRMAAEAMGAVHFDWAAAQEERNALWKARHNAYWAARALAPGKESIATDACVPISRLAECIEESIAEAEASGLLCPIVGHVGDGNFHMLILFDGQDPQEAGKAEALATKVARLAISKGGTCTGEHGIGMHKLPLLEEEHGASVAVMRQLKRALDPKNIMNPGKTVPQ